MSSISIILFCIYLYRTFTDRAWDNCIRKQYDTYYRYEIRVSPRPLAVVQTTKGTGEI